MAPFRKATHIWLPDTTKTHQAKRPQVNYVVHSAIEDQIVSNQTVSLKPILDRLPSEI